MKISELRECERPRERLLVQGASALGNAELLAVLLGSGTPAQSVIDISNALLAKAGWRLDRLFALSVADLESVDGIGPARAATVQAAFELGRRFLVEKADAPRVIVVSGRSVYDLMIPRLKGLDHEECWAVLLDTLGRCNRTVRLTSGGFDSTVLDIRQIVRMAVGAGAAGMVLVHNHPSGDPRPSGADCAMTDKLRQGLESVCIRLVDHVVVSDFSFFSFAENRLAKA
ncbi:MAG: DNA repair protein RadC [Bacteroidales bacterium]|nr:DNA repair protein RadC [Candidatus Cryptobacteroides choladohippi]